MTQFSDFSRYLDAQAPIYPTALAELAAGRKRGHWMWFIFPQLEGLGRSEMARRFGLGSSEEARAYFHHPVLGQRLLACATAVLECGQPSLHGIFGSPDDLKFRSSMTLFEVAAGSETALFSQTLDAFCGGDRDPLTLRLI